MTWLLLAPAALILAFYVLVIFAVARAAGRADRMLERLYMDRGEQEARDVERGVYRPRGGGWRV